MPEAPARFDDLAPEVRTRTMKSIRSRNSQMEQGIASALWRRGLRFRRNVRTLFGTPDLANQRRRLVVFLDSCFWHGCPEHYQVPRTNAEYWAVKVRRNRERDVVVTEWYQERAWRIVRIWEHEVRQDPAAVVERLASIFGERA